MRYHVGIGCSFGASKHNAHKQLAEKMGATFINLSEPGQGNFRIYTELLYWSAVNQEKLTDTTFSIGWSGIYRNDVIEKTDTDDRGFKWTRWRADRDDPTHKNLPTLMDIELDQTVRFLSHVISTQHLLKDLKCKYVMYNAVDTHIDRSTFDTNTALTVKILEKQIDMTSFYEFKTSHSKYIATNKYFLNPAPASVFQKITNWPTDDSQYPGVDAHPSPEGDSKWADLVWEHSQDNQIL